MLRWVPKEYRQTGEQEAQVKPLDESAFPIDGIDMHAAMQYYSGDEEGFADLLELYCMDGKHKTGLLRELAQSDLSRYQIEVHGLKSASANIGAMEVSAMAREQEYAAAEGNEACIAEKFPVLLAEYETLLANIEQFLARRRNKNGVTKKLPGLPPEELREQTAKALEELQHFQSQDCAERVKTVLLHEMREDVEESFLQIQEQLRLYEDDYAEELLGRLLSKLEKEEEQ